MLRREVVVCKDASQGYDRDDSTVWNLHQSRDERGESEALRVISCNPDDMLGCAEYLYDEGTEV